MAKPTKQDAELLLELLEILGTPRFQEAYAWVMRDYSAANYDEFKQKYPEGTTEYNYVTRILGFYEIVAVLITHGLLNEDLFFDANFGLAQVWTKLGPIIPKWREA